MRGRLLVARLAAVAALAVLVGLLVAMSSSDPTPLRTIPVRSGYGRTVATTSARTSTVTTDTTRPTARKSKRTTGKRKPAPGTPALSAAVPRSHRLAATIDRTDPVGGSLRIHLSDRWRLGNLPATVCVAPPGASASCHTVIVPRTGAGLTLSTSVPRPGGWMVRVKAPYGDRASGLDWVSHPGGRIRLLADGDSEMQILDDFLAQDLGSRGVDVVSDARISTGLTNSFFFDWQSHAQAQAAALHPDATVMFLGANDGFAISSGGRTAQCCGPDWSVAYAGLVERVIRDFLQGGGGRVYWFVLPEPRPGSFQYTFNAVNAGIRMAVRHFPGRAALIDAESFFTPDGHYRDFMTVGGRGVVIHESDGVHLSTAADTVAADLVVRQMVADRLIR